MIQEGRDRPHRAALSGLEVRVLVSELSALSGSYVSNIYALGEAQLLKLRRAGDEAETNLLLSPSLGAWVTEKPARTETGEFTTALRGELLRAKLGRVVQWDLDRVFVFEFVGKDGQSNLVLELMPPGNLVLTDGEGVVKLALREARSAKRSIQRGRPYSPPPQSRQSPDKITEEGLRESFTAEKTAGRALARAVSLPRKYIEEVLARASLEQDDPTPVPDDKMAEVARAVKDLVSGLERPFPCLVRRAGGDEEILSVAPATGEVVKQGESMSRLADDVLSPGLMEQNGRQEEDQRVRELEVTLDRLESQATELKTRASGIREVALAVRQATSTDEADLVLDTAGFKQEVEHARAKGSVAAISSSLFDQAKTMEAEVRRIGEAESDVRSKLARVRKVASHQRSPSVKMMERGKREWYEKFRWFFTTRGSLAVGGRDSQTNSVLVKKHLQDSDVVYHADLFGSPFFILKGGSDQAEEEVRQVAQATVAFSSAWKTALGAADAYWVHPDQVSSTAPSGEYLARGSFVIRGKKNFAPKNPVELAVGVDANGRIVSGPEEAVMKQSRAHVTLVPHREKASDTAKKVLFELRKFFPRELASATVDDVLRMLPSGGGRVARRRENWKE